MEYQSAVAALGGIFLNGTLKRERRKLKKRSWGFLFKGKRSRKKKNTFFGKFGLFPDTKGITLQGEHNGVLNEKSKRREEETIFFCKQAHIKKQILLTISTLATFWQIF